MAKSRRNLKRVSHRAAYVKQFVPGDVLMAKCHVGLNLADGGHCTLDRGTVLHVINRLPGGYTTLGDVQVLIKAVVSKRYVAFFVPYKCQLSLGYDTLFTKISR